MRAEEAARVIGADDHAMLDGRLHQVRNYMDRPAWSVEPLLSERSGAMNDLVDDRYRAMVMRLLAQILIKLHARRRKHR